MLISEIKNRTLKQKKNFQRKFKYSNLLNPKAKNPESKFVLYTRGRTGSTVLSDLINCHPDIFCDVEIFNFIYSNSRVRFPILYINSCTKRAMLQDKSVYGFKVKISQLRFEHKYDNYDKLLFKLYNRGWKFIHLKRQNYLRHKLSNILTTQTNIFHVRNGEEYKPRIKVDCKELLRGIVYSEEVDKTETENLKNIPNLKLIYENDIVDNSKHQETADKIFKYLGLSSYNVRTDHKRMVPDELEKIILNYEEVYNFFKDTKYSGFLK